MTRRVLGAPLRRPLLRAVAVAAAAVVLLTGAVAPASADHREPSLRVMTRNLYLGADLTPALDRNADTQAFLGAVASIFAANQATDFARPGEAIAQEIDRTGPDLVGLQEVSGWETSGPATVAPSQDFLAVLQAALAARGLDYRVASTSVNAVIGPGAPGLTLRLDDSRSLPAHLHRPGRDLGEPGHAAAALDQSAVRHLRRPTRLHPAAARRVRRCRSAAAGPRSTGSSAVARSTSSPPTWRPRALPRSSRRRPRSSWPVRPSGGGPTWWPATSTPPLTAARPRPMDC